MNSIKLLIVATLLTFLTALHADGQEVAKSGKSEYKLEFKKLYEWQTFMQNNGIVARRLNRQMVGMFGDKEATKYLVGDMQYDCLRFDNKKKHAAVDVEFPRAFKAILKKKKVEIKTYYNVKCFAYSAR